MAHQSLALKDTLIIASAADCRTRFPNGIQGLKFHVFFGGEFFFTELGEIRLSRVDPRREPQGSHCLDRLPHSSFYHTLQQVVIGYGKSGGILP